MSKSGLTDRARFSSLESSLNLVNSAVFNV